jgi:pseudouridine synthase
MALQRLQKILSAAGVCSRREAEELITEGRVKVNGVVAGLGAKADPDKDSIKVGNKLVKPPAGGKLYLLMNKPRRCVSTLSDPEGRKTVLDFIPSGMDRVYPVGRLDYDTEGLLLLTNDGEFSNAIMHPSRKVMKTYEVKVKGVMTDESIAKLMSGVRLEDGMTAPARVRKMKLTGNNSWLEITIHEGRNRQIRRMCETLGHPVQKIKRTKVGPLDLKGVPLGMCRELTPGDVKALLKAAGIVQEKKHDGAKNTPAGRRGGKTAAA